MSIKKVAAFSDGEAGGNPAGVMLSDELPTTDFMQATAAEIGFSETVFAAPQDNGKSWRVRYFSPESEVPFCGHATIALGSVLADQFGPAPYDLVLNDSNISVEGSITDGRATAALSSPATQSKVLDDAEVDATLSLFGYTLEQLDPRIPPAFIHAGADHYVLALNTRQALSDMNYDLAEGRSFMLERDLVTIMLVHTESESLFNVRNAFASGGVYEDPATGAAAAAFSGYLRDIDWPGNGELTLIQGEDMGMRSIIRTEFDSVTGSSVRVTGATRSM